VFGAELAVGFVVAWAVRKARRVAGAADEAVDQALDADWIYTRGRRRPIPPPLGNGSSRLMRGQHSTSPATPIPLPQSPHCGSRFTTVETASSMVISAAA
jgi:hypothetical protein